MRFDQGISHPVALKLGLMPRSNHLFRTIGWWLKSTDGTLSEETQTSNARCVKEFARWADSRGITRPQVVTKELVTEWWAKMERTRYSRNSLLRFLGACRAWFDWLLREREIRDNPFWSLNPSKKRAVSPPATAEDIDQILDYLFLEDSFIAHRDRAVIAMMASCPKLNAATLVALTTDDVEAGGEALHTRKGDCCLDERATQALQAYTEARGEALEAAGVSEQALFLSWHKKPEKRLQPIHPRTISQAVSYWREKRLRAENPHAPAQDE